MLANWWYLYLYQPLFNALILIYNTLTDHNLGWAVVWLTIFLRIGLLPLTLISEYNNVRRQKAVEEADKAIKAFKNDPIAQRDEARRIMRKYHISPWAKALMLVIQALVLVLLYQVFIRGITGERVSKILYPSVAYPGKIITDFFGFDIGARHTVSWAAAAALYLFVSIYLQSRSHPMWDRSQLYYLIFFPLFTFAVLWYLPMVKSIFILTTMLFSDSISLLRYMLVAVFKSKPAPAGGHGH